MDTYDGSMDAPAGRRPTRGAPAQGDEYDFAIDFEPRREYREGDKEEPGTNNFGREWGNLMKAKGNLISPIPFLHFLHFFNFFRFLHFLHFLRFLHFWLFFTLFTLFPRVPPPSKIRNLLKNPSRTYFLG